MHLVIVSFVLEQEKSNTFGKTQDGASLSLTEASGVITCKTCSTLVPKDNLQLHEIRCSRLLATQQQQQQQQQQQASVDSKDRVPKQQGQFSKKNKSKKKPNKTDNTKCKTQQIDDEDVDALLEEFTKLNNTCSYSNGTAGSKRCTKSIRTLGQKCAFCAQVFCLSHHIAEVHGCGAAAKVKARQDISKYADVKPRPMNGVKKAQVQRKLDKKLEELEEERKRKNKKK